MTSKCYLVIKFIGKGREMKRILLKVMNIKHWKKQEKSFVIAMILMGVFNFFIVFTMLYR